MSEEVCGYLRLRRRCKKGLFSSLLGSNRIFEWKRYFFLLKDSNLVYYKKEEDKKLKRSSIGCIPLKHTYLNLIFQDERIGDGFLIQIIPLIIDKDKLRNNGLESAIMMFDPLDNSQDTIILSADTEEQISMWITEIVRASALFSVDNLSKKSIALMVQESIRDPFKNFNQEDLEKCGKSIKVFDEEKYSEEELLKMRALDKIYSTWKSIQLRNQFLNMYNNAPFIQIWWKYVYYRKLFIAKQSSVSLIAVSWQRYCAVKLRNKALKELNHRKQIIDELLRTEFYYVQGLSYIISDFRGPISEIVDGSSFWDGKSFVSSTKEISISKRMVSKDQLQTLFCNIDSILILHSMFLSQLNERINHEWDHLDSRIGDIFTSLAVQFKVYIQYVNNYGAASKLIEQMRKDIPKFSSFLINQSSNLTDNFAQQSLESLLILPIQRLPRYELLLRDIIKHTWKEHKEYELLQQALKAVNEMTNVINESKRQAENMDTALDLQQRITNLSEDLIQPHRKYMHTGTLTEIELGKSVAPRTLFLFSDILIISTEKIRKFSNISHYEEICILKLGECDAASIAEDSFNIGMTDGSTNFTFQASSIKEKDTWLKLLTQQTKLLKSENAPTKDKSKVKLPTEIELGNKI